MKAIGILEEQRFPGALAIVDSDFDRINGCAAVNANLLITDTHDLESLLLASPALEKLLLEYGSASKLEGRDARLILVQNGQVIGIFRWVRD